jgi:hypothetical protein
LREFPLSAFVYFLTISNLGAKLVPAKSKAPEAHLNSLSAVDNIPFAIISVEVAGAKKFAIIT